MADPRAAMAHLFSCVDSVYRVLGESAPTFTDDACVVGVYGAARALGEVALAFRAYLGDCPGEPVPALEDALRRAAQDPSGAMTVFCLVSVVGPRLLISLRDARELLTLDEGAREVLAQASSTLIATTYAVGALALDEGRFDDEEWRGRARDLARTLEAAGYAESFGLTP